MASDNHVTCYEAIQRIYRNSVVRFLRNKLRARFPTEWENKLRSPFKLEEWETAKKNALTARATKELASEVRDDFDLLSVNHFFNLFDSLSSNSKCNTTSPDGLRCCHVQTSLYAHECRRT